MKCLTEFGCTVRGWSLVGLILLAGCGGGGSGGERIDYYPLAAGDERVLRSVAGGLVSVAVTGTRSVDGQTATVVATRSLSGFGIAEEQLIVKTAQAVHRLTGPHDDALSKAIGPVQLLRFPLTEGDTFVQVDKVVDPGFDVDLDGRSDSLAVHSTVKVVGFESVTAAGHRFEQSAHVRTVSTQVMTLSSTRQLFHVSITLDEWYAPQVGLVLEQELVVVEQNPQVSTRRAVAYAVGGVRSESLAPTVRSTWPHDNGTIGPATQLRVNFSETLDPRSVSDSTLRVFDPTGTAVPVQVSFAGQQALLTANEGWASGTHTLSIGSGVRDLAGNTLIAQTRSFRVDATGPRLVRSLPADGAVDVPLSSAITLVFNEALNPDSVGTSAIWLAGPGDNPPITVERVDAKTVKITPTVPLQRATNYTVQIGYPLTDRYGNAMPNATVSFWTDPGMFSLPVHFEAGVDPQAVAIGDVNDDGLPDIVTTTGFYFSDATDYKLYVFLQQAQGGFAAARLYATSSSYVCRALSIAIADLNGDGRNDVALGESGCGIEIFHQNAQGRLARAAFLESTDSHKIKAADLNGDGRADLVGAGWSGDALSVWRQQAGGGFAAPTRPPVTYAGWGDLDIGDLDDNGLPDLVVSSGQGESAKSIGVLRQKADGSFAAPEYRSLGSDAVAAIAVGDVNGDGRDDLVAAGGGNYPATLGVFQQLANGKLGPMKSMVAYDIPGAVEVADVDGDGRKDVVVAHDGWAAVSVYRQDAKGTLAPYEQFRAPYRSGLEPHGMSVGDIDDDGRQDIVIAGLDVLYNRSATLAAPASTPALAGVPARSLTHLPWWRPGRGVR